MSSGNITPRQTILVWGVRVICQKKCWPSNWRKGGILDLSLNILSTIDRGLQDGAAQPLLLPYMLTFWNWGNACGQAMLAFEIRSAMPMWKRPVGTRWKPCRAPLPVRTIMVENASGKVHNNDFEVGRTRIAIITIPMAVYKYPCEDLKFTLRKNMTIQAKSRTISRL